jgi:hypothetical protein
VLCETEIIEHFPDSVESLWYADLYHVTARSDCGQYQTPIASLEEWGLRLHPLIALNRSLRHHHREMQIDPTTTANLQALLTTALSGGALGDIAVSVEVEEYEDQAPRAEVEAALEAAQVLQLYTSQLVVARAALKNKRRRMNEPATQSTTARNILVT